MINWLVTLLLASGSWYYFGFTGAAVFFAVRFVTTVIPGAVLKTDPPRKHFCRKIYSSMANREADYTTAGDNMRAEAMKDLRARFECSRFINRLTQ